MLAAMQSNPLQFEKARYCEDYIDGTEQIDRTKFKVFKAERVSDNEIRYSQPIQNLITSQDSIVLRTNWSLDFKIQKQVYFRGSWWLIQSAKKSFRDVNPQTLGLLRPRPVWLLELIEAE